MNEILIICLIGAIAGWIASAVVNSDNDSFLVDIMIGIIGGFVGYKIFGDILNVTDNIWVNKTITSAAGATVLALIIKAIKRIANHKHYSH